VFDDHGRHAIAEQHRDVAVAPVHERRNQFGTHDQGAPHDAGADHRRGAVDRPYRKLVQAVLTSMAAQPFAPIRACRPEAMFGHWSS
jgi:hypothetical protein